MTSENFYKDLTMLIDWGNYSGIALIDKGEVITWQRLYQKVDQWSHFLAPILNNEKSPLIAIDLEKSADSLALILCCLRHEITFAPLQHDSPPKRIEKFIRILKPSMVINEATLKELGPTLASAELSQFNSQLAYIMFTSGSTGEPKGVEISKAGLEHFASEFLNFLDTFLVYKKLKLAGTAKWSFDQSVLEWIMLINNKAQLVITNGLPEILGGIEKGEIDSLSTIPELLAPLIGFFKDRSPMNIQVFLIGGGPFYSDIASKLQSTFSSARIFNFYGPTEATVYCSGKLIDKIYDQATVPLGKPFKGTEFSFKDNGELIISGKQLMQGYLGEDRKTHYETGDITKKIDGELYFVQRESGFIKLNGLRISPIELENTLSKELNIDQCIVSINPNNQRLVFYYTSLSEIDPSTFKEIIRENLPKYLHSIDLKKLESFPLLSSGKIDRNKVLNTLSNKNHLVI